MRWIVLMLPGLAFAQVTTNDQALERLAPAPKPAPVAPHRTHAPARARPPVAHQLGAPPPVAAAPPRNPVIAPPPPKLPVHKPLPPPPIPVRADAPGDATHLQGGLTRLRFGAGSADLNPAMVDALETVAAAARANPALTVTITAWAAGTPDDPSTPRRLSLDRALAARAVLLHEGLVSDRIPAIAKGATDPGTDTADRAEVSTALSAPK